MKRFSTVMLVIVVLLFAGTAMAQSLADQAKKVRQHKKASAAKVYTEDDLPSVPESKMAEESHAAEATASNAEAAKETAGGDASANDDADKKENAAANDDAAKAQAAKDKEAAEAEAKEWKSKFGTQQDEIKQLEREVDLMQRENKLRQASYYGDAGNQLRDQKKWADEQRQYQTDLEAKQKALADAKQKLDDTREQARKSGVPTSQLE